VVTKRSFQGEKSDGQTNQRSKEKAGPTTIVNVSGTSSERCWQQLNFNGLTAFMEQQKMSFILNRFLQTDWMNMS
jgi:hypothetical protein